MKLREIEGSVAHTAKLSESKEPNEFKNVWPKKPEELMKVMRSKIRAATNQYWMLNPRRERLLYKLRNDRINARMLCSEEELVPWNEREGQIIQALKEKGYAPVSEPGAWTVFSFIKVTPENAADIRRLEELSNKQKFLTYEIMKLEARENEARLKSREQEVRQRNRERKEWHAKHRKTAANRKP